MPNRSRSLISRSQLLSALLLSVALFSHNALAQNDGPFFGKQAKGKWVIGVKAAKIDNNQEDIKDADAIGIVLGYEFDRPIGDLGGSSTFELEYVSGDTTPITGVGNYEANILNAFFTYRSAGKLYYKLKAGLSYADILLNTPAFDSSFEDVSLAAGIGLGYHVGDYGVIELEYSQDTSDTDLGILGVNALLEF